MRVVVNVTPGLICSFSPLCRRGILIVAHQCDDIAQREGESTVVWSLASVLPFPVSCFPVRS